MHYWSSYRFVASHSTSDGSAKGCFITFTFIKDVGLIRQHCSNAKSTFYTCRVFRQSLLLPEGALSCRWAAADCIVYYIMGGVKGDNLHCLRLVPSSRQVDCARKNRQLWDLTVLIKPLPLLEIDGRHQLKLIQ